ncbi:hypothetical protein AALO_G00210730 [Alosa alosa]|uniref:Uncharacterized protein n=1 Tax=Alosa alosa TaxID=278164 RepID=A0AAV6G2Z8_9TELE|nr:hypothetical protein AALO_G00210730 [Alosa alosa]
MASKCLTIIVLVCALCYLEPDFTGWIVSKPLAPPEQWASTPGISPNPFSALTQFALQLMVKQEQDAHKRVKVTPVRPTDAEPCSMEHTLLMRGPFMVVEDLLVETETRRPGAIVWVISFHRICLLVTLGLLARITIRILLQNTNAPEESKSEGQKGSNLPSTCTITVPQNRAGPHRRKRRGVRSCKDC